MATFKSNMAQAANDMLDLPANLEGILQEVNGQKEVRISDTAGAGQEGKEMASVQQEEKRTVRCLTRDVCLWLTRT